MEFSPELDIQYILYMQIPMRWHHLRQKMILLRQDKI